MTLLELALLLGCEFVSSILGFYIYFKLANRFQIQAIPNYRSLHSRTVPRGGGIVVALSALLGVSGIYFLNNFPLHSLITFLSGAMIGTTTGFIDDILEVRATARLFVQIVLALIIVLHAKWYPSFSHPPFLFLAKVCVSALLIFCIVWFFNLFNFIDGSDGMVTSSVIYTLGVVTAILLFKHQYAESIFCFVLLLPCFVFLYFNWPPAKVFLGGAGSFFLGYSLCFLMVDTITRGLIPASLWLILFAYYFSDTTLTTFVRFLTVPYWYKPHRCHAYQNLARTWNSHLKVLSMVLAVNCFWLLPLALLALRYPHYEYVLLSLAYFPICLFVLKNGPLYEDK